MQYLAWRVLAGLNKKIEISFMLVGHTKFAPDWCFGLVKQMFRVTTVGCLDDMVKLVNDSATVNYAQLVGREDGTILVHQYDWASFLNPYFKRQAFEGLKSLHHLVFSSEHPGKVMVRKETDGTEETVTILKKQHLSWKPDPSVLPSEIQPQGLSHERRQYLYEKIREFCPTSRSTDAVCPPPDSTYSSPPPPSAFPPPPPPPTSPPPPKRRHS